MAIAVDMAADLTDKKANKKAKVIVLKFLTYFSAGGDLPLLVGTYNTAIINRGKALK